MSKRLTIRDLELTGKRVFIRAEFNVPVDENMNIVDDTRIRAELPTIQYALDQDARVTLASHRGRPRGKRVPQESLRPVADRLVGLLGRPVTMADDCIGPEVEDLVAEMKPGDIVLLENLRYHKGETKNDDAFAQALAKPADVYVDDAFGVLHRAHASIVGVPKLVSSACIGFLVQEELEYLEGATQNPARPLVMLLGGAKISGPDGKIWLIQNLLDKANTFIIGGKIAYTFLTAMGIDVGSSLVDRRGIDGADASVEEDVRLVKEALAHARELGTEIVLPEDVMIADRFAPDANTRVANLNEIPMDWMALDIGPKTIANFSRILESAGTIIWNGPMGVYEMEAFKVGTVEVGKAVARSKAVSIIGGGDTTAPIVEAGLTDQMTHICTGGGAMLSFLQGKELPGLAALERDR